MPRATIPFSSTLLWMSEFFDRITAGFVSVPASQATWDRMSPSNRQVKNSVYDRVKFAHQPW